MSYGIIYKATGPGGKVYIGQTTHSLKQRKSAHAFRAKKGDRRGAFQVAILEHGFDSFTWEQIDAASTPEGLDAKEKRWIAHYDSADPQKGYNGTDGGIRFVPNKEVCRKISKTLMGHPVTDETREKMSEAGKGRPAWNKGRHGIYTPEVRRRMSEAQRGEKHPLYGKHHSEETRRKMSEANKGKHPSKESRQKMSEAARHRPPITEETRRRISEAQKGKPKSDKLTECNIHEIRIALAKGVSGPKLAKEYGVGSSTIYRIKYGQAWAHVPIDVSAGMANAKP